MLVNCFFHFLWGDVRAAADDDLFEPARKPKVAILVFADQISGMYPAIAQSFGGSFRVLPVINKGGLAAGDKFAHAAWRALQPMAS